MSRAAGFRARVGLVQSDERGQERLRRVFLTAAASVIARAGTILVLLITVPLTLEHLGAERFGLWMILSSLAALVTFADFGIGNGVINLVSAASGRQDTKAIRELTSTALIILSAIGLVLALIVIVAAPLVNWAQLFGVESPLAVAEASTSVLVFGLCLAVGIPLGLGMKIQIALQQGYAANLWVAFGGLLSFASVAGVVLLDGGVPLLVLALFGSQQFAVLGNFLYVFIRGHRDLSPRLKSVNRARFADLLHLGSSFFLLQLVAVISFRIDAIIVARFYGAAQAGSYAVYDRLFSLVTMIVTICLGALWPAYGEAVGRGDNTWAQKTFKASLLLATGGTIAAVLPLALFHRELIELWVGEPLAVPVLVIAGFAVWKVIEAAGVAMATLLNAMSILRVQLIMAAALAIIGTTLKLVLAPQLGISVVVWSTIVSYLILVLVPTYIIATRALRNLPAAGQPDGQGSL